MSSPIQKLTYEGTNMILMVDRRKLRVNLGSISLRLLRAPEKDRLNYRISPAGKTISWPTLGLEISMTSLLQMSSRYWS